jgi:hypothetical protein
MRRRALTTAIVAALAALLGALPAAAPAAKPTTKAKAAKRARVFRVCAHGCKFQAIQDAVDAAGAYAYRHRGVKVTVAIEPGRYVEEVFIDGTEDGERYDGMTIEGTKRDRKRTVLDGRGARSDFGRAQYGIVADSVDGLVLKSLWARNFEVAGFYVRGEEAGRPCVGYTMENLLASGNGSFGLAAKNCLGGRMIDSAAFRQGAAGFSVAETPCDSVAWSPYSGQSCQARPRWTLLTGDASYENALGFSGTNSRYVRLIENVFYDDGTGIAAVSVAGAGAEPNGWNMIERNYVFWNNYDYYLSGAAFEPTLEALGELNGRTLNYPVGVGIFVYGGDGDVVRANHVFGNYKWGIATLSAPGETYVFDAADEAKNVNNEVVENLMGRSGADPNGEYDIWNDDSGGGDCWGANSANATFAPGNGKVPTTAIYPICPISKAGYGSVRSLALEAGLQLPSTESRGPKTSLGYLWTDPAQDQRCSWVERVDAHPPFQTFEPLELPVRGGLSC